MSTIERIQRLIIPGDNVNKLAKIYYELGYLDQNTDIRNHDFAIITEQNIESDTYFLGLLVGLDVQENRSRLIVTKNSLPRTKDEIVLSHIKEVMANLTHADDLSLDPREYFNIINFIYNNEKSTINFTDAVKEKKNSTALTSKKALWDDLNTLIQEKQADESVESICLYLHYWLDIFNLTPLNKHNDLLTYILLYVVLLKAHINFFRYTSLFELIYQSQGVFLEEIRQASVNWADGYSQTSDYLRFMLDIILEAGQKTMRLVERYDQEQASNKSLALEKTILSFKHPFTKADIRDKHPLVSDSTIQRSLAKLQCEDKIASLGKGRSAQWVNKTAIIVGTNTKKPPESVDEA